MPLNYEHSAVLKRGGNLVAFDPTRIREPVSPCPPAWGCQGAPPVEVAPDLLTLQPPKAELCPPAPLLDHRQPGLGGEGPEEGGTRLPAVQVPGGKAGAKNKVPGDQGVGEAEQV